MSQGKEWFFELVKVLGFIADVDAGDACTVAEDVSHSTLQQPTQPPKFFNLPTAQLMSSIHKAVKRALSPIVDELLLKAINASVVDRMVSAVVANNDYATLTSLRRHVAKVNHTALAVFDQNLVAELQDRVEFRNSSLCQNVLGIPCNSNRQTLSQKNVGSTRVEHNLQSLSSLGVLPLNITRELAKIGCALEVVDVSQLIHDSGGVFFVFVFV